MNQNENEIQKSQNDENREKAKEMKKESDYVSTSDFLEFQKKQEIFQNDMRKMIAKISAKEVEPEKNKKLQKIREKIRGMKNE